MALRDGVASWDSKAVDHIRRVYDEHASSRGFVGRLISLTTDPALERGTTWLLKHHLERGHQLTSQQAGKLYAAAGSLARWESRLHVLQVMAMAPVPEACAEAVESFLQDCLDSENKFVRAWAYSGYADLARAHPEYLDEARALLADAMEHEEAASVRARVRKVLELF